MGKAKRRIPPRAQNAAQAPNLKYRNPFRYWEHLKDRGTVNIELAMWQNHFFFQLYNIAIMRYKWIGLPDDVNYFKLEDYLITNGKCIFIYDDVIASMPGKESGYAVMKTHDYGNYDIYNIPESSYAYANTGYNKKYTQDNSVLIFDKPVAYPTILDLRIYSDMMAKTVMTRSQNKFMQRMPAVGYGSPDDQGQIEAMMKDYNDFAPFLKMQRGAIDEDIKQRLGALNLGVPYLGNEFSAALRQEKAEALGSLGIECNMLEKSERLTSQEAGSNGGFIEGIRNVGNGMRDEGAKQINKLFGFNARVEFNSDLPTAVNGFLADVGMQYSGMKNSVEDINVNKKEEVKENDS